VDNERVQYLRCPYCGTVGGHEKRVHKKAGLFKVKKLYNNILIMECYKCLRIHRMQTVGKQLVWQDMSPAEQGAFKTRMHRKYTKAIEKEVQNEKGI